MGGRRETIDETAKLVSERGGVGLAARTDHSDPVQVDALVQRIEKESGRVDLLVNDVWGGDPYIEWGKPVWDLDLDKMIKVWRQGVETHLVTARKILPLMVARRRGLVVEITDGDGLWYRGNFAYDLVKTTVIRIAWALAEELRPQGVSAVAVTPGFLRSEMMLDVFDVTEANWREAVKKDPNFLHSETPLYVGRAVASLAADPQILQKSGRVFASWTLAHEYGFTDADGSRPDFAAHLGHAYGKKARELQPRLDEAFYEYLGDWAGLQAMFARDFEALRKDR